MAKKRKKKENISSFEKQLDHAQSFLETYIIGFYYPDGQRVADGDYIWYDNSIWQLHIEGMCLVAYDIYDGSTVILKTYGDRDTMGCFHIAGNVKLATPQDIVKHRNSKK